MAEKVYKRKFISILGADAVEYSRLMDQGEEATVRTLTAYREVIRGHFKTYFCPCNLLKLFCPKSLVWGFEMASRCLFSYELMRFGI